MPIASGPATPPTTAPTSPTSPTTTNEFIDCEKGNIEGEQSEEEEEEVAQESDEKSSQASFPSVQPNHRPEDGRPKLDQRSEDFKLVPFDRLLNTHSR